MFFFAGCAPETVDEPASCEGGGVAAAVVGREVQGVFEPYEEGDAASLLDLGGGLHGFRFDYRIDGLDAREPVTAVVRVRFGEDPSQDFLGMASLVCEGEGPSEYAAYAQLDEEYQDPGVLQALDGSGLTVDSVFTDVAERVAESNAMLILDSSGVER